jgi:hypothetical protein
MRKLSKNQPGIAHLLLLILLIVVVFGLTLTLATNNVISQKLGLISPFGEVRQASVMQSVVRNSEFNDGTTYWINA